MEGVVQVVLEQPAQRGAVAGTLRFPQPDRVGSAERREMRRPVEASWNEAWMASADAPSASASPMRRSWTTSCARPKPTAATLDTA